MSTPAKMLDTRHVEPDEADVQAIFDALSDLPTDAQDTLRRQLATVLVNYQSTGQIDPAIHFLDSLLMTARLHRNPAYRKRLKEAAATPIDPDGGVEVADLVAEMRARRGR